jgi:cytochrome c1
LAALVVLGSAACTGGTPPGAPTPTPPIQPGTRSSAPRSMTPAPNVPGDPQVGAQLMSTKGCSGCHTVDGLPGATGVTGPNLTNITLRPTIAGETIPNSPDMLQQWLLDPPALKPGTSMPKLGLTQAEARDLVAFLESQPHTPQP